MAREYSRHYRDSSLVNDHQSDLDIRDDPCYSHEGICRYRKHQCPIPFASAIIAISEIWSSVSPSLFQSRYWHCYLLVPVILHPRDLVTCCNIWCISPSGPRVSSVTRMIEIPKLISWLKSWVYGLEGKGTSVLSTQFPCLQSCQSVIMSSYSVMVRPSKWSIQISNSYRVHHIWLNMQVDCCN
jgi:hypothetical protein